MQVLRKGSGTLCEQLLMVQAFKSQIVCPNKHASEQEVFYKVRPSRLRGLFRTPFNKTLACGHGKKCANMNSCSLVLEDTPASGLLVRLS